MKRSILLLILALASNYGISQKAALPSGSTEDTVRAKGKNVFVSRCAQCHDEDGNKKLPDGTTLLQRLGKSQDPEARLRTRLKDPQERHAVMVYLDDFMTRLRSLPANSNSSPDAHR